MELAERLRKILAEEFGITTDGQLLQAVEDEGGVDIGIFTIPLKGEANARTA